MPVDIRVRMLSKDDKYVYVFEIQQSQRRPHQFEDKYYFRLDGQNRAMPHYLIEAMMKQIRYPDIAGYVKFMSVAWDSMQIKCKILIEVMIVNWSELLNDENVSITLSIDPGVFKPSSNKHGLTIDYSEERHRLRISDAAKVLHYSSPLTFRQEIEVMKDSMILTSSLTVPVKLRLIFGGRLSPLKISSYILNLFSTELDNNINNVIEIKNENLLMADWQKKAGIKKDHFLKDYLGR